MGEEAGTGGKGSARAQNGVRESGSASKQPASPTIVIETAPAGRLAEARDHNYDCNYDDARAHTHTFGM